MTRNYKMDTLNKNQSNLKDNGRNKRASVSDATSELLDDGQKLANGLYKKDIHQANEVEDNVKEYSDKLLKKVQENPLASVLVAGGVGFLLSILLKK